LLLGATKHARMDAHVAISAIAFALRVTHLAIMRRGVVAYARLLVKGRRSANRTPGRRPKAIVFVRAILVVAMVSVIPVVAAS